MVHITGTCTTSNEIVGSVTIEGHVLDTLCERESLLILHENHTLGS